jgi:hypothetical protein
MNFNYFVVLDEGRCGTSWQGGRGDGGVAGDWARNGPPTRTEAPDLRRTYAHRLLL